MKIGKKKIISGTLDELWFHSDCGINNSTPIFANISSIHDRNHNNHLFSKIKKPWSGTMSKMLAYTGFLVSDCIQ